VGSASPSGHSISSHSGDSFSGISLLYPRCAKMLSTLRAKNIPLFRNLKSLVWSQAFHSDQGRTRRHERGAECGGCEMCRQTCGAICGRRSRVVLARPCRRSSSCEAGFARATVATSWFTGESTKYAVNHCAGKASCHRLYLWSSRSRAIFSRGGPGCSGHPVFPAPFDFPEGAMMMHNSGESRHESKLACTTAICDRISRRV
jgi:hypothetical protein